ncbi:hypothetical protein AB0P37_42200, partial [Streptomyces antimycoticus]|uniref:hypothetical protein n=1 Tax=Streptomyces antimycoticus TaxID=68175 RepID=UPI003432E597
MQPILPGRTSIEKTTASAGRPPWVGRAGGSAPAHASGLNLVVLVVGEDRAQVPLAGDEEPVGALGTAVRIHRSANALGRGLRGGVGMTGVPFPAKTASNAAVNLLSRSRIRNGIGCLPVRQPFSELHDRHHGQRPRSKTRPTTGRETP